MKNYIPEFDNGSIEFDGVRLAPDIDPEETFNLFVHLDPKLDIDLQISLGVPGSDEVIEFDDYFPRHALPQKVDTDFKSPDGDRNNHIIDLVEDMLGEMIASEIGRAHV